MIELGVLNEEAASNGLTRKHIIRGSQLSGEKKMKKRLLVSSANGSERGSCRTGTKMKKMKVAISWNSQGSRHSSA